MNRPYAIVSGRDWYHRYYARAHKGDKKGIWASFRYLYQTFIDKGLRPGDGHTLEGLLPDVRTVRDGREGGGNAWFETRFEYSFVVCTRSGTVADRDVSGTVVQESLARGMLLAFACVHIFDPRSGVSPLPPVIYLAHFGARQRRGYGAALVAHIRGAYPRHAVLLEVEPPHDKLISVYLGERYGFRLAAELPERDPVRFFLEAVDRNGELGAVTYPTSRKQRLIDKGALDVPPDMGLWATSAASRAIWLVAQPVDGTNAEGLYARKRPLYY